MTQGTCGCKMDDMDEDYTICIYMCQGCSHMIVAIVN